MSRRRSKEELDQVELQILALALANFARTEGLNDDVHACIEMIARKLGLYEAIQQMISGETEQ